MTVEHRLVVGLDDIRAVTLECKNCHVRLTMSPDQVGSQKLYACGACEHRWLSDTKVQAVVRTAHLATFLAELKPARDSEHDGSIGVRVLLEYDGQAVSGVLPPTA